MKPFKRKIATLFSDVIPTVFVTVFATVIEIKQFV